MTIKRIVRIICLVSLGLAAVACSALTPTPAPTPMPADKPIATLSPTSALTATPPPTSTPTITSIPTSTPTVTHTPTSTPTVTPTPKPADVRLISDLQISNPKPLVGETITATFKVRNFGEQTFTAWRFGVKGRGPDDSIQDFFMVPDFSLNPGDGHAYLQNRSFSTPGKYWFTPHCSPDGANWYDVTWPDDRLSHVEITVDSPPVVEGIYLQPSAILQGDAFVIRVIASDDFGVQSVRWWSKDTGDYYLDKGQEAPCGGGTRCEHSWPALKWTGKDGEFSIYAEARDTAGQSSSVVSTKITTAARFSLSVGGGAFTNESVQNALGFGIDWVALRKEIGEVVLVDFLSEETLPGPTGTPYRPDSAKELLAGAGYSAGFDAALLFDPDDQSAARLADLVASYLSVLGIRPEYLWVAPTDARTKLAAMIAGGESSLLIERR